MPDERATVKTSISLDADLAERAKDRAEELGFKHSFSGYLAKLIKEDLASHAKVSGVSGEIAQQVVSHVQRHKKSRQK